MANRYRLSRPSDGRFLRTYLSKFRESRSAEETAVTSSSRPVRWASLLCDLASFRDVMMVSVKRQENGVVVGNAEQCGATSPRNWKRGDGTRTFVGLFAKGGRQKSKYMRIVSPVRHILGPFFFGRYHQNTLE